MSCERYLDEVPVSRLRLGADTFSAALRVNDPGPKPAVDARSATFLLVQDPSAADPVAVVQPSPQ